MLTRRAAGLAVACAIAAVTSACGGATTPPAGVDARVTAVAESPRQSPAAASPAPSRAQGISTGRTVVLDPGHNGGNAAHPAEINKRISAGRGLIKQCNTTGTATADGYPEHAFNWDLAGRVRDLLTARGVRVVMTRQDDTGVGPCVDRRAAIGNESGAAAVVSLHADGAETTRAHGFHIAYSAPPLNDAQGEPSLRLAEALRGAMRAAGLVTATYIGSDGLDQRDDLAGLNLSTQPVVLVECGNMRNPEEAARMSSPAGRQHYAEAIANGILAFLG
ncbi:N-acetylmuramoyl-L-alanine amidase [Actinokineospora iranica]|uniref:N-acetylmuramoyl-L-alanine amidase n=1 Tax=Actinokineospora iranica TaxID=1271860 RepID=A0A1G6Y8U7_9PSEU|nr:N-acetylmuramoyl-L-alanine amidase [Actinokineospora iranica]SDD86006.1 N-acetylmuramoyl-L-alanine amidase [Actinokineospora iranica]